MLNRFKGESGSVTIEATISLSTFENEYKNSYQKNSISDSGNLYIAIFEN